MSSYRENPYYTGESTPKHLKHGPVEDRRCTDLLCLTIFLVFGAGTIGIAYYSFTNGDPIKLTYVFDQFGNECGVGNASDYPYLFFIKESNVSSDISDPTNIFYANETVCVSLCPNNETKVVQCIPDSDFSDASCQQQVNNPQNYYPTTYFVNRFCVPSNSDLLQSLYNIDAFDFGFLFKVMADLQVAWWMMIVAGLIALIFGFVFLILMKSFARALLWGLLVGLIALLIIFGILCLKNVQGGGDLDPVTPSSLASTDPFLQYLIAITCFLVALIAVGFVCYFRKKINLSIAVLETAVKFIEEEKKTLLVPPMLFIVGLMFYIAWIFIAIYIIGTNDLEPDNDTHYPIGSISWSAPHIGMIIYHIFGLFWNHALSVAVSQFIIASAACLWYFTQKEANVRKPVVWTSIKRTCLHLGSLALGGFLVGLLGIIISLIRFFKDRLLKNRSDGGGKRFCLACCSCCFSCFERFLQFINRHAYIQIAMTGKGFCQAAKDAYYLLTINVVRFGLVHELAWLFLIIGELFITFISTFLSYIIISQSNYFTTRLYSTFIPTIFFFLVSWMVSSIFMGVYGISADAIIHCFAMDKEIHNGNLHKKLLSSND